MNDGGKFVCFDDQDIWTDQGHCLIYSFGISNDWTFEDQADQLGCTIHAFDPTVEYPEKRGRGIHFTRLGLADRHMKLDEWGMGTAFTLDTILAGNNHTNSVINYLKVDIEGWEVGALEQWLESGIKSFFIYPNRSDWKIIDFREDPYQVLLDLYLTHR